MKDLKKIKEGDFMKNQVKKLMKLANILLLLLIFKPLEGGIFSSNNSKVIAAYNEELNDEFYFVQGLDRERSLSTNIKYRGLLYSKKMKEAGVRDLLEIGLEDLDNIRAPVSSYRGMFAEGQINTLFENEAKKFFGSKVLLQNTRNGYFQEGAAEVYKKSFTKKSKNTKGKSIEEILDSKGGFYQTLVTVFVKDLKNLDKEEYKKKALDLANYMFDNLNVTTSLQIFIRDESYLEDYEKVIGTIVPGFEKEEEIKVILKKVKKNERISEEEKLKLLSVMYRYFEDWNDFVNMLVWMREKKDFPLKVIYSETKDGETTYEKMEED